MNMQELAKLLPALSNTKETQLSKHVIVDESVKRHKTQQSTIDGLTERVDKLLAEQDELLAEINMWRECVNVPPRHAQSSGDMNAGIQHASNARAHVVDGILPLPAAASDLYESAQIGSGLVDTHSFVADVQLANVGMFEQSIPEVSDAMYIPPLPDNPPSSQADINLPTFEPSSTQLPERPGPAFHHKFQAAGSSDETAGIPYVSRSLAQNGEVAEPFRDGRGSFVNFATSSSRPGIFLLET